MKADLKISVDLFDTVIAQLWDLNAVPYGWTEGLIKKLSKNGSSQSEDIGGESIG